MVGQLHRGLSFEQYCALPGINASLLKEIDKTTLRHAEAMLKGTRKRESDALDFGHSFHEMLLRGVEDFAVHPPTYAAPKGHTKVKSGEIQEGDPLPWNWAAGICKDWGKPHGDKIIHSEEEAGEIRGMVAAVRARDDLSEYLNGDTEFAATAERQGEPVKALIDLLPSDPSAPIIDFKKCRSASPRAFVADALKLGYHLQAAFYLDVLAACGIKRDAFWFVAVEDKAPHAISICRFKEGPLTFIRNGRAHYRAAFAKLLNARKTGEWPEWESCDAEDFAPTWMREELEQTA